MNKNEIMLKFNQPISLLSQDACHSMESIPCATQSMIHQHQNTVLVNQ